VADRAVTPEVLIDKAAAILSPYALDVKEVAWWSAYEIGQRVCDQFDDVPDEERAARTPRIFISGDACHTHSPKAGQGMNVSMADSFNLGWKLAMVLQGRAGAGILHSYSQERQAKAKELIDFDRDMARLFSEKSETVEDAAQFQTYFKKHGRFTAGVETKYEPSALIGTGAFQHLATGQTVGMRFHSAPVVRLADARLMELGHALKADGRWRLIAFAQEQDRGQNGGAIARLCAFLTNDPSSPVLRYRDTGGDVDSVLDLRVVFQTPHREMAFEELPDLLKPRKGRLGLIDYEKVFCRDLRVREDIFAKRGIDRKNGALVVVRPDQFVAEVLPLHGFSELGRFLDRFLVETN